MERNRIEKIMKAYNWGRLAVVLIFLALILLWVLF